VIVPPDVLPEVQREAFAANPALRGELPLQIPPESFEAVDMPALPVGILPLPVIHQPVDVSLRRDPRVSLPPVGDDRGAPTHALFDDRLEVLGVHAVDHLRPHLPVPTQDAENGLLFGTPAPFCGFPARVLPPIAPLAAHVCLVHLDDPREGGWDVAEHGSPELREELQEPVLRNIHPIEDGVCRMLEGEFGDDPAGERASDPQSVRSGSEGVPARRAAPPGPLHNPELPVSTAGTGTVIHGPVLRAYQVSVFGLYPR